MICLVIPIKKLWKFQKVITKLKVILIFRQNLTIFATFRRRFEVLLIFIHILIKLVCILILCVYFVGIGTNSSSELCQCLYCYWNTYISVISSGKFDSSLQPTWSEISTVMLTLFCILISNFLLIYLIVFYSFILLLCTNVIFIVVVKKLYTVKGSESLLMLWTFGIRCMTCIFTTTVSLETRGSSHLFYR